MYVVPDGGKSRVTWDSDFLPHALSDTISALQDAGRATLKKHFEKR